VASALLDKAENASSLSDMATGIEKAAIALNLSAEVAKTRGELSKVYEEISRLKYENRTAAKRARGHSQSACQ